MRIVCTTVRCMRRRRARRLWAAALLMWGVAGAACATSQGVPWGGAGAGGWAPPVGAPPSAEPFVCPATAGDATPGPGPAAGQKLRVATTVAPLTSIVANV